VVLPFLPFVLYERWRRRRERLTPAGQEKERAVQDVMRRLTEELRRGASPGDALASTRQPPEEEHHDE
jgi:hypothetical protein